MTQDVKEKVERFLRAGERDHGIKYLQNTFNISSQDAGVLVDALENEISPAPSAAPVRPDDPATTRPDVSKVVVQIIRTEASGCLQTVAKGLGVFLMIISIVFLVAAATIYFLQSMSINKSDRVIGVVREMRSNDNGASAPVLEFEWRGNKRSYESTYYSMPPEYHLGEEVFLFVNRDDPEDITIDTFIDRWALIVGLSVPGAVIFLISIGFLYFGKRKF